MKITAHKVHTNAIYPILHYCFDSDDALVSKWHIASGTSAAACADRTDADLRKAHESLEFYKLHYGPELVGFFGKETIEGNEFLTTIFVHPQFRKTRLNEAWKLIQSHFTTPTFRAAIYAKNTPCSKFYAKKGKLTREFNHDGHAAIMFTFSTKESS